MNSRTAFRAVNYASKAAAHKVKQREKSLILLFLFFSGKEKESKETARAPLHPARRRCGRSTRKLAPLSAGLKQSARLFPSAPPMLSAGQRENQPPKQKTIF